MIKQINLNIWDLEKGIEFVQRLEPQVRKLGYCTALGGSVIQKGKSFNDLDIYIMPLADGKEHNPDKICTLLVELYDAEPASDHGGYLKNESKEVWKDKKDKVDFFIYY